MARELSNLDCYQFHIFRRGVPFGVINCEFMSCNGNRKNCFVTRHCKHVSYATDEKNFYWCYNESLNLCEFLLDHYRTIDEQKEESWKRVRKIK
jgi:hypothetical protein